MSPLLDITVVIPYFNESRCLLKVIDALNNQSRPPACVIFINSSSTDAGPDIIDRWIKEKGVESKSEYINLSKNTSIPSASKNIGIRVAKTQWIALMDCGLLFGPSWLESQWQYVSENHLDISYGQISAIGRGVIDKAATALTYGVGKESLCLPGSLIKKSVFEDIVGYFVEYRAGYDVSWRSLVQKRNVHYGVNKAYCSFYDEPTIGAGFYGVIKKSLLYSFSAFNIKRDIKNHLNLMFIPFFLFLYYVSSASIFFFFISFYLFFRCYVLLIKKSSRVVLKRNAGLFVICPVVAIVMDVSRSIGALAAFFVNCSSFVRKKFF